MFEPPIPDADAVLRNVINDESDEVPEPLPLACLGAMCRPLPVSELCPAPLAVLIGVLNDEELAKPAPEPLAVLMFV